MVPAELGALSPAEQRLWDAFPHGAEVALTPDDPRAVRAQVIRALLLGAHPAEPGHRAALRLRGADVAGRLDLYQADVASAVELIDCTFDDAPHLSFATLRGCSFEGSTLPGLDAFGASVEGNLSFFKATVTGAVVIYGVHVSGDLDFDWARLTASSLPPETYGDRTVAVLGDAVQVGRHLYLQSTAVTGNVELAGARVGGAIIGREGLRVDGELCLRGAEVTGEVNLTGASLSNPGGVSLDAWGLRAGQLFLLPERVDGTVDLRHARVGVLRDDPRRWPSVLHLDGVTYTALEPAGAARDRLPWLDRDPDGFRPQPYERLAAFYRHIGYDAEARTVLLAKQRRRRRQLAPSAVVWGLLQDGLVGYGYRPGRAAMWLLTLAAIGTTVFNWYPPQRGPGAAAFHPLLYTLDLLIPIVSLGQESAFGLAGQARWLAYVLTAMGWILFTAVAAALTRTVNRS
ncbi:membrane-associated oxidoreductase [Luedemannella flava]|uniref:Membrane-associated oxidoreductase n=1 Tax=Luedemannella flava TaxID=349316 RepID=A0ABN2M8A5_9ACTN